ncbi:MAG: hypothetical protein CMH64_04830 [Nanoarchaeota archaeon]|nr:hypothetical protein [Nanoarchaeota archaeon]|tara:strand:+ start:1987 stop:2847 length:861 start_codon:yes stop_codon:yes gene_type:complete
MPIPDVVIVRTLDGQSYAEFIAKEINLKGYSCGITSVKNLRKYLKKSGCSPNSTIIHSRTANPYNIYSIFNDLKKEGYTVINTAETIRLTSDKLNSSIFAMKNKIPCAESIKIRKSKATPIIKEKVKEWDKIIVKPITSQGQGEFCFKFDKDNIKHLKKINKVPMQDLVLQRFIDHQRLNRVIVIGFKALKNAVFWDSPEQNWKCSVCENQMIKHYKNPPKDLLKFAENVARKIDGRVSFIDIFTTKNGYYLNEINTACDLTIHEGISKYNISGEIANHLISYIKK